MNKIKVSIVCATYNHEKFIRQALEGFIMQKTNFPFEVIIHDDASTDGTADIIREYASKYPDIIKPILQTENQRSKNINRNKVYIWPKIQGEYVALNEGDDYWTDPLKLQKQVDFLDAHPDYSVCFHNVRVIWQDKRKPDYIFPTRKYRFNKKSLELNDLLKQNFIQTNSVMYRWRKNDVHLIPDVLPGDWYLHLFHAQVGKIGFLPDVMSVYRRHSGGLWTGAWETDEWFIKCAMQVLEFFKSAMHQFNHDYSHDMIVVATGAVRACLRNDNMDLIKQIRDEYPEIWNDITQYINVAEMDSLRNRVRKYKRRFTFSLVLIMSELIMIFVLMVVLL